MGTGSETTPPVGRNAQLGLKPVLLAQAEPPKIKTEERDRGVDQDWKHIEAMDKRISIDKTGFLLNFSPVKIQNLLKYLTIQVKAIHWVEEELKNKWGISEVFKKIKILAPGPFNNTLAGTQDVEFILGNPKEYTQFFVSPTSTYAHELGHYLENFDVEGRNRLAGSPTMVEVTQIFKKSLTEEGALKCKYLEDVPYHLLPYQFLFPQEPKTSGLFYYVRELVADKVSLQFCGYIETKKRIIVKIEKGINSENPWELIHLWVLAHEYCLNDFKKELFNKLVKYKAKWEDIISTQKLLDSLSKFFNKVSLKKLE